MSDAVIRNAAYVPRAGHIREPQGRLRTGETDQADPLSRASIERRVLRACKTIRAIPDKERKHLYHSMDCSMWSQALDEWTAYGSETTRVRFTPTPADLDDCLIALNWCRALDRPPEVEFGRRRRLARPEWQLVWSRSYGWSFRQIGLLVGRSDKTIERWYDQALDKLHRAAKKNSVENCKINIV